MRLWEKEYFRIFAYRQIMEEDCDYKMSLILNQTMDYKNLLSQSSRVYRRVLNLAFGENPDKNMIFFRPLKICQGDHAELVFRVKENKIPFFAEIGTYGIADDTPSDVIVINHTETVLRFEGTADHAYEITVERKGETLDPLWETEYLEGRGPEEIRIQLERIAEQRRKAGEKAERRLKNYREQEETLERQIHDLEQKLKCVKKEKQETDGKFAELLRSMKSEIEELNTYFLKLKEIGVGRGTEDKGSGTVSEKL